ncbi:unnamed protein product, partial [Sphacelaria rigidula]
VRETSSGTNQWSLLLSLLPEAESARVKRFVRENDRRLALGSRLLQRALVFGVGFSEADIRRTTENKPYFAGVGRALLDGTASQRMRNWNFNVSHHGKFVAIASEPVCLCGVDIVDTAGRRRNTNDTAEEYLRYFTDHFTAKEWEAIRRAEDDDNLLRRFFLNWGLKESYVKAVGQGLGFNLRRISFIAGDWLNCCSSTNSTSASSECCSCGSAVASSSNSGRDNIRRYSCCCQRKLDDEHPTDHIHNHHRKCQTGCSAAAGASAEAEVDNVPRKDWSFRVFPLANGYAACVARGPPSACSASGQAVGVVSDPRVGKMEQGLGLPQIEFEAVRLVDILRGVGAAAL